MVDGTCGFCGKAFKAKPSLVAKGKGKYCSRGRADNSKKIGRRVECSVCHTLVWRYPSEIAKSKTQTFFCSPLCRSRWANKKMPSGEKHSSWKGGAASYRRRAIEYYGATCCNPECVLRKAEIHIAEKMLDVDHIDSDRANNSLSNLAVLCVWCHAIKTRSNWGRSNLNKSSEQIINREKKQKFLRSWRNSRRARLKSECRKA